MKKSNLLFATPHGSHLYGNSHENSDKDTFEVYANRIDRKQARYARQTIVGNDDILQTDLSTFVMYAAKGVPQYLEAMYSRIPTRDNLGRAYRFSFVPHQSALHTYRRTVASFWEKGEELDDDKFRRHAHRLAYNSQSVARGRYFNPTLNDREWNKINSRLGLDPLLVWAV